MAVQLEQGSTIAVRAEQRTPKVKQKTTTAEQKITTAEQMGLKTPKAVLKTRLRTMMVLLVMDTTATLKHRAQRNY